MGELFMVALNFLLSICLTTLLMLEFLLTLSMCSVCFIFDISFLDTFKSFVSGCSGLSKALFGFSYAVFGFDSSFFEIENY